MGLHMIAAPFLDFFNQHLHSLFLTCRAVAYAWHVPVPHGQFAPLVWALAIPVHIRS